MARDQCCRGLGFFCLCVPVPVFFWLHAEKRLASVLSDGLHGRHVLRQSPRCVHAYNTV